MDSKSRIVGIAAGADEPFETRYLKYVAISEGCGCAERVIRDARAPLSGDGLREVYRALVGRITGAHRRKLRASGRT